MHCACAPVLVIKDKFSCVLYTKKFDLFLALKNKFLKMKITDLNDDELIIIFKYCNELDHRNVAKVCRAFEKIIEFHFNEKKCRNLLIVSHLKSHPELFERTINGKMKFVDRLRVHQNWMYGTCKQMQFHQHKENYETHLELDGFNLYTASLGEFNVYQRSKVDGIKSEPIFRTGNKNDSKITSLKRKGELVVGSRAMGTIFTYDDENEYNEEFVRDSCDPILDVDFMDENFVTVSRSETNFHRLSSELGMQTFDYVSSMNFGFSCINFNPTGEKLLGVKSESLHILDPTRALITKSYLNRSQVFTTKWLSSSSFVFTSYSNPLTLIDIRTDFKRQEFSCGNFTATSVDYDGCYGLIYGTLLGMMVLCDLRNLRTFERVFHLDTTTVCRHLISDESNLFVSTDNAIHLLNFNW